MLKNSGTIGALCSTGKLLLVVVISFLLVSCGNSSDEGGESNEQSENKEPNSIGLTDIGIIYSDTPTQGKETSISLITEEDVSNVEWVVVSQPDLSNLILEKSSDGKSVVFTASEPGEYKISVRSPNGTEKSTTFHISPVFSLDESQIEGYSESGNVDELISIVKNQSWVYSSSLNENEIRNLVANYSVFTVVGYDAIEGLLIEYDEASKTAKEALEELKLENGIDSVSKRTFEGKDADKNFFEPNDGSQFDDAGDNWHLESSSFGADLVGAWEITTGSSEIVVGITDSGFYSNHEDLVDRFSSILTNDVSSHGTGVAGTIGAESNNKIGISGINHISKLSVGKNNKNSYLSILNDSKVKVINNSWGAMGKDSGSTEKGILHTRKYRKIAQSNNNVLHVWAAGNDGADANTQNGAIHLNSLSSLSRLDNVVVVAAVGSDGSLVHYSDYGKTVDIAAQTEFRSTKKEEDGVSYYYDGEAYGEHHSGGFNGTSAAAPVVSGVSSLIYSLYPDFSAEEVKKILVESTNNSVSTRHKSHTDHSIEKLSHPIPILNAKAALDKAQDIIDSKVTVTDSIPDPFTPQVRVSFKSIDEDLEVVGIDWELQSTSDGASAWEFVDGMSVNGDVAEPMLDTNAANHRLVATVTLRNPDNNTETTATKEYEFSYITVDVIAKDTVTLDPLEGVAVDLELLAGQPISTTGFTDNNGVVNTYLKPGTYKFRGNLTDYQEAVTTATINGLQSQQVNLNMTSDVVGSVGSLSGTVLDANGQPVVGASVRISGGEQTNGFFASAKTDVNGSYVISNISKTDTNGDPISSFALEASAFGFTTVVKEEVIVLIGKERVENFTLMPQDLTESTIFSDDFEQGVGSWTGTGFWNQVDLSNNTIVNTLVDDGYTSLAPDEAGPQAVLPNAFSGDFAWWYGQSDTGSFIGTQFDYDGLLSGGKSTDSNNGQLVSPSINLISASMPFLRFKTWWEIESVNPNENGFDLMKVQISTDGGDSYTTVKKLNPFVDPNDSDREHKPFSSGGFNRAPVWVLEEVDLSGYSGEVVTIKFNFQTNDELFNGFRGWIIDDVEVVDFAESGLSAKTASSSANSLIDKPSYSTKKASVHLDGVSKEFLRIHKKPKAYSSNITPTRVNKKH